MYYLLWRGQITGPYTINKIKRMLTTGRITSLYKVSADLNTWVTINKDPIFSSSTTTGTKKNSEPLKLKTNFKQNGDIAHSRQQYVPGTPNKNSKIRVKINHTGNINNNNIDNPVLPDLSAINCPICKSKSLKIEQSKILAICKQCKTKIPLTLQSEVINIPNNMIRFFYGYTIEKVLGTGGMGVVYQAKHHRLNNRKVALKVLSSDKETQIQIKNEVAALVQLSHPSIVTIFDIIYNNRKTAISMELISGPAGIPLSLRDIINTNGPLEDLSAIISICKSICAPLAYAHKQGVYHLDLKPENILIDHLGNFKIVDFGIAQFDNIKKNDKATGSVKPSSIYGTIGYSAPERLEMKIKPHANQDVYSLGVILYELLLGKLPEERYELPSELIPELPEVFDFIAANSLNSYPERRFANMELFDKALSNAYNIVRAGNTKSKKLIRKSKPTVKPPQNIIVKNNIQAATISVKNSKIKLT